MSNNNTTNIESFQDNLPILLHPVRVETRFVTVQVPEKHPVTPPIGTSTGTPTSGGSKPSAGGNKPTGVSSTIGRKGLRRQVDESAARKSRENLSETDAWNLSQLRVTTNAEAVAKRKKTDTALREQRQLLERIGQLLSGWQEWLQKEASHPKIELDVRIERDIELELQSIRFISDRADYLLKKSAASLRADREGLVGYLENLLDLLDIEGENRLHISADLSEELEEVWEQTNHWQTRSRALFGHTDNTADVAEAQPAEALLAREFSALSPFWTNFGHTHRLLDELYAERAQPDPIRSQELIEGVHKQLEELLRQSSELQSKPAYFWKEMGSLIGYLKATFWCYDQRLVRSTQSLEDLKEEVDHLIEQLPDKPLASEQGRPDKFSADEVISHIQALNRAHHNRKWQVAPTTKPFRIQTEQLIGLYRHILPTLIRSYPQADKDQQLLTHLFSALRRNQQRWQQEATAYLRARRDEQQRINHELQASLDRVDRFLQDEINAPLLQPDHQLWQDLYHLRTAFDLKYASRVEIQQKLPEVIRLLYRVASGRLKTEELDDTVRYELAGVYGRGTAFTQQVGELLTEQLTAIEVRSETAALLRQRQQKSQPLLDVPSKKIAKQIQTITDRLNALPSANTGKTNNNQLAEIWQIVSSIQTTTEGIQKKRAVGAVQLTDVEKIRQLTDKLEGVTQRAEHLPASLQFHVFEAIGLAKEELEKIQREQQASLSRLQQDIQRNDKALKANPEKNSASQGHESKSPARVVSVLTDMRARQAHLQEVVSERKTQLEATTHTIEVAKVKMTQTGDRLVTKKTKGDFDPSGPLGGGPARVDLPKGKNPFEPKVKTIHQLWVRIYPDVFAIETHDPNLSAQEIAAGRAFWQECWQASAQDRAARLGAWRALCAKGNAPRAAWIVKQLAPTNMEAIHNSSIAPDFPNRTPKTFSWSKAPCVNILPDHFVVELYRGDQRVGRAVGESILTPLIVGIDPQDETSIDHTANGDLVLSDDLKWTTDFNAAVARGMGVKIEISKEEATSTGFTKVLVAGVRTENLTGSIETGSQELLEKVIENHNYAGSGMRFLMPGQPTNNTPDRPSTFKTRIDPNAVFDSMIERPYFTESTLAEEADGSLLSKALGISSFTVQGIPDAQLSPRRNARHINTALWPATWGFFLEHALGFYKGGHFLNIQRDPDLNKPQEELTPRDTERIRDYFIKNVFSRGPLPTFRIRRQAYGLLPVSKLSHSNQVWNDLSSDKAFYQGLSRFLLKSSSSDFDSLLYTWLKVGRGLATVDELSGSLEDIQQGFMNLLGLHPHSVEFYNRYGLGRGDKNLSSLFSGSSSSTIKTNYEGEFEKLAANFVTAPDYLTDLYSDQDTVYGGQVLANLRVLDDAKLLQGRGVDPLPSREDRLLNKLENENRNYIQSLLAHTPLTIYDQIRTHQTPSRSLLYLLLRAALMNEYVSTAMNLYETIQLGDFGTRSLDLSNIYNSSTNGSPNYLPPVPFDHMSDLKMDWLAIAREQLTLQELKQQAIDNIITSSIPNVKNAYNLLRMLTSVNGGANNPVQVDNEKKGIMGDENNSEDLVANNRIEEKFIRTFYRQFTTGILPYWYDNNEIEQLPWLYVQFRDTNYYINNFPEYIPSALIPANSRLPFLFFELHHREMKGIPTPHPIFGGSGTMLMSDYLHQNKGDSHYPEDTRSLRELKESFAALATLPTAELERLMAEHIDLCSYRLDAWILGLYKKRLELMREQSDTGIYLGAYGWVFDLKPDLGQEVISVNGRKPSAVTTDPDNQGFIHAPSLNHALAAAILRSGYTATGPNSVLEVNLSSRRIRRALFYLEGIRNGQSLNALLGYQLERGLHDNNDDHLSGTIYELRQAFPLINDQLTGAASQNGTPKVNQVIDGLRLLEAYHKSGIDSLPNFADSIKEAVAAEIKHIETDLDALADLCMAEGIYQVVLGNYSGSNAMMSAISEGKLPPEPEIIRTPRTGTMLTHRMGITMKTVRTEDAEKVPPHWPETLSPRAQLDPSLNYWIGQQIGNPHRIACTVESSWADGSQTEMELTMDQLDIQPIDFLLCFSTTAPNANELLLKRLRLAALQAFDSTENIVEIKIHLDRVIDAQNMPLVEMQPLLVDLFALIAQCRPLHAEDIVHPSQPTHSTDNPGGVDLEEFIERVIAAYDQLNNLKETLYNNLPEWTDTVFSPAPAPGQGSGGNQRRTGGNFSVDKVVSTLLKATSYNLSAALPQRASYETPEEKDLLIQQARTVHGILKTKLTDYGKVFDDFTQQPTREKVRQLLLGVAVLFGSEIPSIPLFLPQNSTDLSNAYTVSDDLLPNRPMVMESWLTGVARVRPRVDRLESVGLLQSLLDLAASQTLTPMQLPYRPGVNDQWVGTELSDTYFEEHAGEGFSRDKLSLVFWLPETFDPSKHLSGLLIDEWSETIPNKEEITGVAMHYDQPNARPPQNLLLALHPSSQGGDANWQWSDLTACIDAAIDLAKIRAVEPDHFGAANSFSKEAFLAHALPATLSRVIDYKTVSESSENLDEDYEPDLSTDYLLNNDDSLFDPVDSIIPDSSAPAGTRVEIGSGISIPVSREHTPTTPGGGGTVINPNEEPAKGDAGQRGQD